MATTALLASGLTGTGLAARGLAANNFGDTESGGLAGPMGLFVILLLAIGTVLLIRNMNARLRRLPERFPSGEPGTGGPVSGHDPADGAERSAAGSAADRAATDHPAGS